MKALLTLFLLLFLSTFLTAQSQRDIVSISPDSKQARWQSPSYAIPLQNATPFLSYFLKWEGIVTTLNIRFSPDGQNWSAWEKMPTDEHAPDLPVSILRYTGSESRFFQVESSTSSDHPYRLECHFFNPGTSVISTVVRETPGTGRSCSDLMPPVLNRAEWCPTGNCKEHPSPAFANITHIVIHHSASSNESSDWPAVVRSIWDFHVNGRGWSDIGYNWLVDPEGQIYEGRSTDAIGAHFCSTNTGTLGVCLLGNFMEETPKAAAISALEALLSWKVCENAIDPLAEVYHPASDLTLPTIIGHRDGCATACPGDLFYPQIPAIRVALSDGQTTPTFEKDQLHQLRIFPNPTHQTFTLVFPDLIHSADLNFSLYDLLGHHLMGPVLIDQKGNTQKISLPDELVDGAYFLVFRDGMKVIGTRRLSVY